MSFSYPHFPDKDGIAKKLSFSYPFFPDKDGIAKNAWELVQGIIGFLNTGIALWENIKDLKLQVLSLYKHFSKKKDWIRRHMLTNYTFE